MSWCPVPQTACSGGGHLNGRTGMKCLQVPGYLCTYRYAIYLLGNGQWESKAYQAARRGCT